MKRKILNLIIIFISILMILCTGVYATSEGNDTSSIPQRMLEISTETNGDELSVYVSVNGTDAGIIGMQGNLVFDSENLELTNKEILIDNFELTAFNEETGKFLIEIDNDSFLDEESYIHESKPLLKLTFNVKKQSAISIEDIILIDGNFESIDAENIAYSVASNNATMIVGLVIAVAIVLMILTKMLSKSEKYVRRLSQKERRKANSRAQ